jgi:hypothetical protein
MFHLFHNYLVKRQYVSLKQARIIEKGQKCHLVGTKIN